jgi:hypothetical protein
MLLNLTPIKREHRWFEAEDGDLAALRIFVDYKEYKERDTTEKYHQNRCDTS